MPGSAKEEKKKRRFTAVILPVILLIAALLLTVLFLSFKGDFWQSVYQKSSFKYHEYLSNWGKLVTPEKKPSVLPVLVDDFSKGTTSGVYFERQNSLGGYQGTWSNRPSYSIITKVDDSRGGKKTTALAIQYKKEAGWCGWYTLLNGLDASKYNTLSFWVKGDKGGEKFDIGVADSEMVDLGIDAVYFGPVNAFLQKEVTKEWCEVKVPLSRVASQVDLFSLESIVFNFKYGGEGKVYIDYISLKDDPEVTKLEAYNLAQAKADKAYHRSMWVWKTDPVNNTMAEKALLDFCGRAAVDTIYLYFGEISTEKSYLDKLAQFLEEAHKRGVKVEALTGNPTWVLSENHQLTLDWIKSFLEFNKDRKSESRFDGVHLDIEPYLLAEWADYKEEVKRQHIELLKKCRQLVDSYDKNFSIGLAIPVFFDKEEDGAYERRILENIDYFALMDYYNDSVSLIKNAKPHVEIAKEMGKKIVIGVETQDLMSMHQGLTRNTFFSEGWNLMEKELRKTAKVFKGNPAFEGFGIHAYESYRLLQRGRNVQTKERPKTTYTVASAEKKGRIAMDGTLEGWDLTKPYLLDKKEDVIYGAGAWRGKEDYSLGIYSQWDEQNLYFAFKITDDKLVQQWTGESMWQGDHIEMWLDVDLAGDYNEAVNSFDDFQFGLSPGNFSTIQPEVYIWTPNLETNYKGLIDVKASKTADGYIIEARIPLKVLYSDLKKIARASPEVSKTLPKRFSKGMRLGISVDPSDTDSPAAPQKLMMSTSRNRAWGDPTTFGILELK